MSGITRTDDTLGAARSRKRAHSSVGQQRLVARPGAAMLLDEVTVESGRFRSPPKAWGNLLVVAPDEVTSVRRVRIVR